MADDGTVAICPRTEVGSVKRCGEAGWLHLLSPSPQDYTQRGRVTFSLNPAQRSPERFAEYVERARRRVGVSKLQRFADQLGVAVESLRRLLIGWDGGAWTFPMCDAAGQVIGVRRRFPDGTKRAIRGSQNGLFIPEDLQTSGTLLIAEGESDCAALLTLGFNCVGRPSCDGGGKLLVKLARGRDVVIVADGDTPGQRGASRLAAKLVAVCSSLCVVAPPRGLKDARAWLRAGARRADVLEAIRRAPILRLRVKRASA